MISNRNFYYFISVVVGPVGIFALNYYFSKVLSLEAYGSFNLLFSIIAILSSLFMCGQATAISIIYFSDEKKDQNCIDSEIKNSIAIISAASIICTILLVPVWFKFFHNEIEFFIFILSLGSAYFLAIQGLLLSALNCKDRYEKYLLCTFSSSIIMCGLVFFIPHVETYPIAVIAGSIFTILLYFRPEKVIQVKRKKDEQISICKTVQLKIGLVAIPGMLISSSSSFFEKYILSIVGDLKQVAIYSIAALVGTSVGRLLISGAIKPITIDIMSHLQNKNFQKCKELFINFEYFLIIIGLFAFLSYYTISVDFIIYIFGNKFSNSTSIILILFSGVLLEGMMQLISHVILQAKKLHYLVINGWAMVVLGIILNYFLIGLFELMGLAITFFLTSLLTLFIVYIQAKKFHNWIKFPIRLSIFLSVISLASFFMPALNFVY